MSEALTELKAFKSEGLFVTALEAEFEDKYYRFPGTLAGLMWLIHLIREQDAPELSLDSQHYFPPDRNKPVGMTERSIAALASEFACKLSKVGGRTNMTHRGTFNRLVALVKNAGLDIVPPAERVDELTQGLGLVARAIRVRNGDLPATVVAHPPETTRQIVVRLLDCPAFPAERAQYLVGAVLDLTCAPAKRPQQRSLRARDSRDMLPGDYLVGGETIYEICTSKNHSVLGAHLAKLSIARKTQGHRPCLLVSEEVVQVARAEAGEEVACEGLGTFITHRIDMLADQHSLGREAVIRELIDAFNRIAAAKHPQAQALRLQLHEDS